MRFIFLQLVHQHDRACKSDVLLTFQLEVNREILRAFLLVAVLDFISSDQDFFVQDLIEPELLSFKCFFFGEVSEPLRHWQAPEIA